MSGGIVHFPSSSGRVADLAPERLLEELIQRVRTGDLKPKGIAVLIVEESGDLDPLYAGEPFGMLVPSIGWLEVAKAMLIDKTLGPSDEE